MSAFDAGVCGLMPNVRIHPKSGQLSTADLLRAAADKLDDCVIPAENERIARLMALHLCRVVGDPHFAEEARLLIEMVG